MVTKSGADFSLDEGLPWCLHTGLGANGTYVFQKQAFVGITHKWVPRADNIVSPYFVATNNAFRTPPPPPPEKALCMSELLFSIPCCMHHIPPILSAATRKKMMNQQLNITLGEWGNWLAEIPYTVYSETNVA